jgi:hypothetical protein
MDKEPDTPRQPSRFERFTKAILTVPPDELAKQKERYEQERPKKRSMRQQRDSRPKPPV